MATTAVLLATLAVLFVAIGFVIAGPAGATIAFALSLLVNLVAYWHADTFVLRIYKAKPLSDPKLEAVMAELARDAKLPAPKLYRIASTAPNAFATGRNPEHAAIAVTDGLLAHLSQREIRAVLGHELGHVKNRDMLVASMAGVLAGAIGYLAQIGYWMMLSRDSRERNPLALLLIVICAPLAALLVRLAISRRREFAADNTGAHLSKDPESLASALKKIEWLANPGALRGPASTGHLWISNPFGNDWFSHLFRTHPPVSRRVERLEKIELK